MKKWSSVQTYFTCDCNLIFDRNVLKVFFIITWYERVESKFSQKTGRFIETTAPAGGGLLCRWSHFHFRRNSICRTLLADITECDVVEFLFFINVAETFDFSSSRCGEVSPQHYCTEAQTVNASSWVHTGDYETIKKSIFILGVILTILSFSRNIALYSHSIEEFLGHPEEKKKKKWQIINCVMPNGW